MKYIILILALTFGACAHEPPVRPPCKHKTVELDEIMIEIQNNVSECAVRLWSRSVMEPLFEIKGSQGIENCKIYIIQNPEAVEE